MSDARCTVLVAEDNAISRDILMHQLRLIGCDAVAAADGAEAADAWRAGNFALLLTDLQMPELDGYALSTLIRSEETNGRLPIVALTANRDADEAARCTACGMDACLAKPDDTSPRCAASSSAGSGSRRRLSSEKRAATQSVMSKTPKSARILVCGDNVDDAADVVRALGSEFETVEASTKADAVVADFERFSPDVIVLAFDAIEKSQAYCHGLLRLSKTAHAHPHRTVILCGKDETQLAFELCKKRFFDDYVLYWPQSHDGLRLKMSVWNAACRLAEAQAGGHGDMAAQADSARALETIVDRQLTQGMGHVSTARDSIAGAERGAAAVDPRVRVARSKPPATGSRRCSTGPMAFAPKSRRTWPRCARGPTGSRPRGRPCSSSRTTRSLPSSSPRRSSSSPSISNTRPTRRRS